MHEARVACGARRVLSPGPNVVAATDIGLGRELNEDAFYAAPDGRVLAVADGLGGLPAGEVASAIAVGAVAECTRPLLGGEHERQALLAALERCFATAQADILDAASDIPGTAGMATTLVTALVSGSDLYAGHLGDVRAYRASTRGFERLTEDHTRAWELVQDGILDEHQARHHPYRNALTRVLGMQEFWAPTLGAWTLERGDLVLLCSDGLWDPVSAADMAGVLRDRDAALPACAVRLLDLALAAGAPDNVTLVAYRHPGTPD